MLAQEVGDVEVEARIVDENHHVGLPVHDVALHHSHVAEDDAQVEQYGDEAHIGHLPIVAHTLPSDGLHQVAANEAELRLGVFLLQCCHEAAGMQLAAGLTNNEVIFHSDGGLWGGEGG